MLVKLVKELAILMFIESFDLGRPLKMLGKKKQTRPPKPQIGGCLGGICLPHFQA